MYPAPCTHLSGVIRSPVPVERRSTGTSSTSPTSPTGAPFHRPKLSLSTGTICRSSFPFQTSSPMALFRSVRAVTSSGLSVLKQGFIFQTSSPRMSSGSRIRKRIRNGCVLSLYVISRTLSPPCFSSTTTAKAVLRKIPSSQPVRWSNTTACPRTWSGNRRNG